MTPPAGAALLTSRPAPFIIGAGALILFGIGLTFLNFYYTLQAVESRNFDYTLLIIGAKESIVPIVFSFLISTLVLFAHYGVKTLLHAWGAVAPRS